MATSSTTSTYNSNSNARSGAARLNAVDWIALVLLIVGGLNWGLVGAFGFDLVAAIFGTMSTLSRIVYVVVGVCALYTVYLLTVLRR